MIFQQLQDRETSTYTYFVADSKTHEGVIIDPVDENFDRDLELIKKHEIRLSWILETHIHADHVTSAFRLREATGAKIGLGQNTKLACADRLFADAETFKTGSIEWKIIFTPGHTNGCTSYYIADEMVFTGDALLINGCGRTDFQEGSSERLFQSVREKIFALPDSIQVYPAHDYQGRTNSTIGDEKKNNPRLRLANSMQDFVKIMSDLKLDPPKHIHRAVPANMNCGKTSLQEVIRDQK